MDLDSKIIENSEYICRKISDMATLGRARPSQDMLSQLRSLVEYTALKVNPQSQPVDYRIYNQKRDAVRACSHVKRFAFLTRFWKLLSASSMHDFNNEDASERLVLKYYQYLRKIRDLLAEYGMAVLENLEDFPEDTDEETRQYHRMIADVIEHPNSCEIEEHSLSERYYIISIHPFFVERKRYYEVTFCRGDDSISKYDRIIAFTKCEIMSNYAVSFTRVSRETVTVIGTDIEIMIIHDWAISVRACEFRNFARVFSLEDNLPYAVSNGCRFIMQYMKDNGETLADIVKYEDSDFDAFVKDVVAEAGNDPFLVVLEKSRAVIRERGIGCNIVLYLLSHMRNVIIKAQLPKGYGPCPEADGLVLDKTSLNFDLMPLYLKPHKFSPHLYALLDDFDLEGREHEVLARVLLSRTENNGTVFFPEKEVDEILAEFGWSSDKEDLVGRLNALLPDRLNKSRLLVFNRHYYIREFVVSTKESIKQIISLSQRKPSRKVFADMNRTILDSSDESGTVLSQIFQSSCLSVIYGAAGTGKTTLLGRVAKMFPSHQKVFLAVTNTAVNNLRSKIAVPCSTFSTIFKFTRNFDRLFGWMSKAKPILFIDECSNVSNSDLRAVLGCAQYSLIVLCGDAAQISPVGFGNWFRILPRFIDSKIIINLATVHRTAKQDLLQLWNSVRSFDSNVIELMAKSGCSRRLDEQLFDSTEADEVVLCTTYSGFYGINNINRIMQARNKGMAVRIGENVYKVGDPVLINESGRFGGAFYNNQKGRILDISIDELKKVVRFTLQIGGVPEKLIPDPAGFTLVSRDTKGNRSTVSFDVDACPDTDGDIPMKSTAAIPFCVAYAVSIHKAQGLEYDSVKIVVSRENQNQLSPDVLYTAITRARKELSVFWSPETEKRVVERMKKADMGRDINFITQMLVAEGYKPMA